MRHPDNPNIEIIELNEDDDITEYRRCLEDVLASLEAACDEADAIADANSVMILQDMWDVVSRMIGVEEDV